MKAFKAYDIRGVYGQDWDKDDVYKIGYFLPRLLETQEILVGRDIRNSSAEIFTYLTRGLADAGAVVYDLGLTTTPMVYWATASKGFKGSVQITASHNAKEYNGLKVTGVDANPIGYDAGLHQIKHWMETERIIPVSCGGGLRKLDVSHEYQAFLSAYLTDQLDLNVAFDLSNGMAGLFGRKIFGEEFTYLNAELDGDFPGHDPNPLNPENLIQLKEVVRSGDFDIGVIFDGDADRVMFVDEKGDFISPDLMIAVLGEYFLKDTTDKSVLIDIRTSRSTAEWLKKLGAEVHVWKVGRAFASPELRRIDGLFGGELAGHYYFKDFYFSDSGMLAALIILGIVSDYKKNGIQLSEKIDQIKQYQNSGEINYTIVNKEGAIEAIKNHFLKQDDQLTIMDFDGIRLDSKDWWLNIRPSNTEPYLRFIAEARTENQLQSIISQVEKLLCGFK